jgi:LytR cell envelope-related transcriptional attenuator
MSNRSGGFPNDDVVRGAGVQLAKGAGLVLVAIIIGVVLLQVVDDGKSGPVAAAPSTTTTTTKTTSSAPNVTTTTKKPTTPAKSPEQVRVVVLNAGAKTGAAKATSTALRSKGYTNQPNQATDWANKNQTGNTVLCKPGFEREASSLAVAVGNGAKTVAFPTPPPPSSTNVDCVVAVGA